MRQQRDLLSQTPSTSRSTLRVRVRVFLDQYRSAAVLPAFCSHHTLVTNCPRTQAWNNLVLCSAHAVNYRLGKQLDELKAGAHTTELASCNILENSAFWSAASRTQPKAKIFRQFSAFTAVGCSTLKKSAQHRTL